MTWYRKIKPPRRKSARAADSRAYQPRANARNRTPLKVRDPKKVFSRKYSRTVYLSGYKAKLCTQYGMARFFGVSTDTIQRWRKHGALPPPFMYMTNANRRYPVFLAAQFRCLVLVVNDLVDDGYLSIHWARLPDHIEMLQEGYAVALKNFKRRLEGPEDTEADKFGVIMLD